MFGPFIVYHSHRWDQYLDNDYVKGTTAQGLAAPNVTLRNRLRLIEGVQDIRRLDYFVSDDFELIMVNMASDSVQAVNGMEVTTIQWESKGGMQLNFKVLGIQVPRIHSVFLSGTGTTGQQVAGIIHASSAA
jgi:hypothetical protein